MILWLYPIACHQTAPAPPENPAQPSDTAAQDTAAQDSTSPDTITGSGATVLITEAMSGNADTLSDEDGETPDWLELYNPGPSPVQLEGWGLSDEADGGGAWRFPALTLAAGEFRVVFASGKDRSGDELHTDFKLSDAGELLHLLDDDGETVDTLSVPALADGRSFGRAQVVTETEVIGEGSPAWLSLSWETGWAEGDFDQSGWREVVLPVGFEGDVELENVALGQETTQSTDGYGYTGVQAVDGDLSTFTHTNTSDLTPSWTVTLDAPRWISAIALENRRDCCANRLYNTTVSVFDEDGTAVWVSEILNPTAEGQSPIDPGATLSLPVDPVVEGAAVTVEKVAVNGDASSEWLSLAEVEVFAGTTPPYGLWIQTDIGDEMRGVSDQAWLRCPISWEGALPDRLVLTIEADHEAEGLWGGASAAQVLSPDLLADGAVLGVSGTNQDADDPFFFLSPTLLAQDIQTGDLAWFTAPTPGAPNGEGYADSLHEPTFSAERGFYDAPIDLTVTAPEGAALLLTLDGTDPSTGDGIRIEPEDGTAQATLSIETTGFVRAMAEQEGALSSAVATHTYIFLADVIRQPAAPAGWPQDWDGISQDAVSGDYEMDPEVVEDPAYTTDLLAGLRDIPTLSIVADPEDLFGADAGIYVHSLQRGDDWERAVSLELIEPDGTTGVATVAGLRMHGYGWRYHSNTLKHSMRLEFRPEYGPSKLEYPLFADAPVERFDSIVLRSQGSRGWQDFRDPEEAQYIRDAFARDTARDMGKLDGHAAYVHLYLNGLYWGLYMPVERPDAGFGAEYFGGASEDYDAINRRTTTNEAIDGDLEAYEEMLAVAELGLDDDVGLAAIQEYLSLEDLIDYMLIHQYTVNRDGPEEYQSNNMRGIRKREAGAQFHFFVWDMEYSIWDADDNYNIEVDVAGSISSVYAQLRNNPDFRSMYSERAWGHLSAGGALTPEACTERWEARATEIERAVVAESARWGDTDRATPYTRDVEWQLERERLLTEFFPYRTDYLIEQLSAAGLLEP